MSTNARKLRQVVLASSNAGKLQELNDLLRDVGFEVLPQSSLNIEAAAETGLTFVENAIIKARHACSLSGLPAIADDSGLEVDALHGKPGIHSARFAADDVASDNPDQANNAKLLNSLEGLTQADRNARFRCLLVFMRHHEDPAPIIGQGSWEGRVLHQPQGTGGFGYDPLFYAPERDCSAAQLNPADKNLLSHRGKALRNLKAQLRIDPLLSRQ